RFHLRGQRARKGISVDVEGMAIAADANRGDDWDEVGIRDHLHDMGIVLLLNTYVADVHRLHDVRFRIGHLRDAAGDHKVGILAADANRLTTLAIDGRDDLLIDGAGEHHLDHLDRRLVRDAEAVYEL